MGGVVGGSALIDMIVVIVWRVWRGGENELIDMLVRFVVGGWGAVRGGARSSICS